MTAHRDTWAPATVIRRISSLRSFGKWLFATDNFLDKYRSPTPPPMVPHPVPGGMASVIVMATQATQPHHKALIALCGMLGLRVSEARNVYPDSFVVEGNRDWLIVRGKGDKTRRLEVLPEVMKFLEPAIARSIARASLNLGGNPHAYTLVPLSDRGARAYITRHGIRETGKPIATHDLRSTFATASYANTQDLAAVQELMGHADPKQTKGYTAVSDEAKRRAMNFFGGHDGRED